MAGKSNRFKFLPTPLEDLYVVERSPISDRRGVFCRLFCEEEFREAGFLKRIVQINHSYTVKKGAVRGLHFQYPPHAEVKIVSCIRGEVFDVAVDIRMGSSTFLKWHGEILSAWNNRSLLIPEGFAHGFQTLTEECELLYLHSSAYCAEAEGAIHVNDPRVGVSWPLPFTDISERDCGHAFLGPDFEGIAL